MSAATFKARFREASAAAGRPLEGLSVPRRAVLVAAAGIVLLYAAHVNGRWRPSYDDAHYLILGRSIAAGEGYRVNGRVDNALPPGMALLLAGVFATVGESFWVLQGIEAALGLGALVVIHAGLKRLTDPATALLVTAATALSYRFYAAAGTILTDVPATMLFWLTVVVCVRGLRGRGAWLAMAAVVAAALVLLRAAGLVMMGALGVGLLLDGSLGGTRRRRLWAAAAVVVPALATALTLYALAHRAAGAAPRYEAMLHDNLLDHRNPIVIYGARLADAVAELPRTAGSLLTGQKFSAYGVAIVALSAAGIAAGAARRRGLAAAMCLLYPLGLIAVLKTEYLVHPRMWFPIQPLMLLLAIQGAAFLCVLTARRPRPERMGLPGRKAAAWAAAGLLSVAVATSLPRVFKEAFNNVVYGAREDYYARIKMPEIGAMLPLVKRAAELDGRQRPVYVCNFHEAKLTEYVSGRRTVEWPDVDLSGKASVESARAVHRRAADESAISTVLLPLKYRIRPVLAGEIRKAFDTDPAWRLIMDNEYYALYHRAVVAAGRGDATDVETERPATTQAPNPSSP